jgi:carboxypeptidase Taq
VHYGYRITTRYHEDFINAALFGSMHECGHGLYENGVSPALERTLLCRGASSGLHESQSRMWENYVGRSRSFWKYFYPRLQATFPQQFANVDLETFYRAVNKVQTRSFASKRTSHVRMHHPALWWSKR